MKKICRNIISIFIFLICFLFTFNIIKIGILPNKYLILIVLCELILYVLGLILFNLKKKVFIIIGIIIYIILSLFNGAGYYYISKINKHIDSSFSNDYYSVTTKYYVVSSMNDSRDNIKNINKNSTINYYKYGRSIKKAMKILGNYNYYERDKAIDSFEDVKNGNLFLISKDDYDYFFNSTILDSKDNYKIIYEFDVTDKINKNMSVKDSYNIYINGLDFTGVMRDYNLIVTINNKKKKILLTSMSRDTLVDVPDYKVQDTLMCLGYFDSEVSKRAIEKFLDTNIDYTINVNTNSLVNIVDSIDGVEFCSDYDFVTSHALVLNTYDDTQNRKLHVTKGCKKYNGIEILTIARERIAIPGSDNIRQMNCRQILINIAKKLASTTTLKNYDKVIKSFDGLYTTDMNDKVLKRTIKSIIEDNNYEIIEQNVDGHDEMGIVHLGTVESWITRPYEDSVASASKNINSILKER